MKRLITTLGLLIIALALTQCVRRNAVADLDVVHDYRLDFKGNAGVKVHLLLITKPASHVGLGRREEVVTLPAQIDFKAVRCYAWVETLPKGESGNDGDTCNVALLRDGSVCVTVEGTIKKQNRESDGLGDM